MDTALLTNATAFSRSVLLADKREENITVLVAALEQSGRDFPGKMELFVENYRKPGSNLQEEPLPSWYDSETFEARRLLKIYNTLTDMTHWTKCLSALTVPRNYDELLIGRQVCATEKKLERIFEWAINLHIEQQNRAWIRLYLEHNPATLIEWCGMNGSDPLCVDTEEIPSCVLIDACTTWMTDTEINTLIESCVGMAKKSQEYYSYKYVRMTAKLVRIYPEQAMVILNETGSELLPLLNKYGDKNDSIFLKKTLLEGVAQKSQFESTPSSTPNPKPKI